MIGVDDTPLPLVYPPVELPFILVIAAMISSFVGVLISSRLFSVEAGRDDPRSVSVDELIASAARDAAERSWSG